MTRSQRLVLASGIVLVIAAAATAYYFYTRTGAGPIAAASIPGERVATDDGRVAFTAPAGWVRSACPSGASDCVQVWPPGAGMEDSVTAMVVVPDPHAPEGDISVMLLMSDGPMALRDSPWLERVTIAGVAAVKTDMAKMPEQPFPELDTSVITAMGWMPGTNGDRFVIMCNFDRREPEIRAGCDLAMSTFTINR